jgi:ABC-2 type transport system ATP-binding protein
MPSIIEIRNLTKTYASGTHALDDVTLDIREGEILALLGPNGAGKTTLISTICGLVQPTSGTVTVGGFDIIRDYRKARALIGLVPQELHIEPFEKVGANVALTRGLFGRAPDPAYIEKVLRSLSLWEKKDAKTMELSGGMKRRVLIAKALSHGPKVLFLDEPSAGVDVNLRRDMWALVRELRAEGVTIILTTHYIEEAEEMADRVGVINKGKLLLLEDKTSLMKRFGKKTLHIEVQEPITEVPEALKSYNLTLEGQVLSYAYDVKSDQTNIARLISELPAVGLSVRDLETEESSLEEVFLNLVAEEKPA